MLNEEVQTGLLSVPIQDDCPKKHLGKTLQQFPELREDEALIVQYAFFGNPTLQTFEIKSQQVLDFFNERLINPKLVSKPVLINFYTVHIKYLI